MSKWLSRIVVTVELILLLWGVLSYVEIVSKNMHPNPRYSEYNMLVWAMDNIGGN